MGDLELSSHVLILQFKKYEDIETVCIGNTASRAHKNKIQFFFQKCIFFPNLRAKSIIGTLESLNFHIIMLTDTRGVMYLLQKKIDISHT